MLPPQPVNVNHEDLSKAFPESDELKPRLIHETALAFLRRDMVAHEGTDRSGSHLELSALGGEGEAIDLSRAAPGGVLDQGAGEADVDQGGIP